ncbi:MAG: GWxTD domain-containing protein [Candidatus Marinimicrobia bacterium]|nr:GWxTD domain-containing protein [Candidatus Neomarinimicrobiota bacterium]
MRKLIIYILLIFSNLLSQVFDMDCAVFKGDENVSVIEVILLIPRNIFKFVRSDDGFYRADVEIRVALSKDDTVKAWDMWRIVDKTDDTTKIKASQKIPEMTTLTIEPGEYELYGVIIDMNKNIKYVRKEKVNIRSFASREPIISDIELCSSISKTESKNKFSRYFGYDLVPNASSVFGLHAPILYPYCEIYNIKFGENYRDQYSINYQILDINDNIIQDYGIVKKNKPGNSVVEIGSVNVSSLRSGIYKLKISFIDEGDTIFAVKKFYVVNETEEKNVEQLLVDFMYSGMSEEELDRIFGPLKYIATDNEIKRYKKANIEGKRQILIHFWDSRDPDPTTEVNEAKLEFMKRLEYANTNFGNAYTEGWKTDMGRIIIQYGFPSEIERYPSSMELKPYQIWHYYNVEGGVVFIFVDKSGFGVMELVHSTARKEIHDEEWQRWINQ